MSSEAIELLREQGEAIEQFKEKHRRELAEVRDLAESLAKRSSVVPAYSPGEGQFPSDGVKSFLKTGDKSGLAAKMGATDVDADGGYVVVPYLDRRLFDTLAEANPLFADVERVSIDSKTFQRVFTVSGAASGRVAERGTRSDTATPTYARPQIDLTMQYALPSVTEELLLSSSFDVVGHVTREIATAFDADFEAEIIGGDGVAPNQQGILTAASSYDGDDTRAFGTYQLVKSGVDGVFDYDALVTLLHSLPVRYRRGAKLYASTSAIELMRKLKDADGMPLWRDPSLTTSLPQSIMGVEVVEVPGMPAVGTGSKSLMFGRLADAYAFVSHDSGLQILRDPYTTPGSVKFYSRMLCGSGVMDSRALRVMELAV